MNIKRAAVVNEAIARARIALHTEIPGETPEERAHRFACVIAKLTEDVEREVLATLSANAVIGQMRKQNEEFKRALMVVADRFGGLKIPHREIASMESRVCSVRHTPTAVVFEMADRPAPLSDPD